MKSITAKVFEKFTKSLLVNFLPDEVKAEDLDAIRVRRTGLADIVSLTCEDHFHDGSAGESKDITTYHAICQDGTILSPPEPNYSWDSNYAYSQRSEGEGVPIGEAWVENLANIKYIVKYRRELNDWSGGEHVDKRTLTLYLVREDDEERIKKIRRRAEDALRKTDPETILRVATALRVSLD